MESKSLFQMNVGELHDVHQEMVKQVKDLKMRLRWTLADKRRIEKLIVWNGGVL